MIIEVNESLAKKVHEVVSCGLSNGLGVQEPGKMCVEAAVNYACGLPHGDNPSCVGYTVRAFKIALNDKPWSSNEARGNGMIKIAIAQLGSNQIDQVKFVELLAIKNVQKSLSNLMRKLGHEEEAVKCEQATDLGSAEYAAKSAKSAAEYAAESAKYDPDFYFKQLADICLECLIELKSPGCEFLYLCEK